MINDRFVVKADDLEFETTKHLGPHNHPNGTPQSVHGNHGDLKIIDSTEAKKQVENFMKTVPAETMKEINAVRDRVRFGMTTTATHRNPVTREWYPDRSALHEKIIESFFEGKQPVENPEMIFLGGLPGSGKTSAMRGRMDNYVVLDADEVKKQLPEYEGWNAPLLHGESAILAQMVFDKAIQGGYNIVNDGTLRNKDLALDLLTQAKQAGYSTKIVFVGATIKTALSRMLKRFKETSRFIDPAFYVAVAGNPAKTFHTIKDMADAYEVWDNNGDKPTLMEST